MKYVLYTIVTLIAGLLIALGCSSLYFRMMIGDEWPLLPINANLANVRECGILRFHNAMEIENQKKFDVIAEEMEKKAMLPTPKPWGKK